MTPPRPEALPDREARRAIREHLDDTIFVEAAAGTGKTTALVGRIVEVIRRGRGTLEDIVAVTFTEKAAGEMKLRLRADLESARIEALGRPDGEGAEEARNLERALQQLELAHIGTIHGFCADLLGERPIEAGVDPSFRVAAEDEAGRLLDAAFDRWFEDALADPPPGVRRALRRHYGRNAGGPRGALRSASQRLADHRDFDAAWTAPSYDRETELERAVGLIRELAAYAPLAAKPNDWLTKHFRHLERWLYELDTRERVHGRDPDGLEAALRSLVRSGRAGWRRTGYRDRLYGRDLLKDDVRAHRDDVKRQLDEIVALADADLAALLREELRPVIAVYEELKRREGRLDFVDLLLRVRDLLRDERGVRRDFRRRFSHFFVDEFQDTDPLQVEILLLLSGDDDVTDPSTLTPIPGKLFLVGDPKQSIYRFRRADVMLYEQTKRRLAAAGAVVLQLTTSFRGQPRIQAAVNGAFTRRMTGSEDGSQADYVPLAAYRDDADDQPAVIALPVPAPYGQWGSVYKRAIEDSLPIAIGALVDWIVRHSGWTVTEREEPAKRVPIEPRHVCLLFRRFQSWGSDVTRPYVRALEAREIPHVLVGGRSYFDREEVLAVRNALTAIEWPDDALSVYATLRGPLFSLGDGTLLHFASEIGPLHPLAPYGRMQDRLAVAEVAPELASVSDALRLLGRLHAKRNRRPLPQTILRLLAAVRAHAGIAIWPTGEQALANVLRVVDRARAFEKTGAPSFRAFLDRLEDEAERGQAEEAPIVEEGTDGVRIMTVHKAKGLEFPVVVLADMTCNASFDPPSRHVDTGRRLWAEALCGAPPLDLLDNVEVERVREAAEADRLAYVAATRARDLLVVPALADGRDGEGGFPEPGVSRDDQEWWLDALGPALFPPEESRRTPRPPDRLACPAFGPDGVVSRLDRDGVPRPPPRASVAPGLHEAAAGNEVVWWDAHALSLGVDAPAGRRQQRLLEVDHEVQPTLGVEEGIAAHEAWQRQRARTLAAGVIPEIDVRTVKATAAASVEAGAPPPPGVGVEWIELPRAPGEEGGGTGRPGGDRFGTLVHAALATVPLASDGGAVREAVAAWGATLGATPAEAEHAAALVSRTLGHELLRRARAAGEAEGGSLRREVPLHVPQPDGTVLEGVADLAFRETGADGGEVWVVVDYKTDRSISLAREIYERQVALYAGAIARATGAPARGVVFAL